MRRAQAEAQQLADAAGVPLGPVYDTRTEAAATPVLPGSREVAVTVELVHALGRSGVARSGGVGSLVSGIARDLGA